MERIRLLFKPGESQRAFDEMKRDPLIQMNAIPQEGDVLIFSTDELENGEQERAFIVTRRLFLLDEGMEPDFAIVLRFLREYDASAGSDYLIR